MLPEFPMSEHIDQTLTKPHPRLERGDRFPNFFLPDQSGTVRSFLERAEGTGMALFLDPTPALLAEIREYAATCRAAGLDCFTLRGAAPPDPHLCILADPAGKVRAGLRSMSGQSGSQPLVFLLDRNQRVIALQAGDGLARWALARWREEAPAAATTARQVGQTAPVLIVPNVLSREECRALIERWSVVGHAEGTVTGLVEGAQVDRVYDKVKKRRDHRIMEPAIEKALLDVIGRRIAPELDKAFHFRRFRFDRLTVVCYDSERGDYFRRHRDNQTPQTADRRFALTINLNSEDYDGGELQFPEYGDDRFQPPTGGAILFSCALLHEALPVTRGRRFALLSFLRRADEPGGGS
jgi:predicted 2-oxoglutarate/Fe(II)-dependent dioxygenase YbiX